MNGVHFESRRAGAIASAPLILGFDASDDKVMDRVWPVITNKEVLHVSQSYAGSAGRRITLRVAHQVWAKPLGQQSFAVFVLSNSSVPITVSVALGDIDPTLNASGSVVVARDLHAHKDLGVVTGGVWIASALAPHDSRFITLEAGPRDKTVPTG